jgi:hypothetical protein
MRLAAAVGVVALALAGAVYVHQTRSTVYAVQAGGCFDSSLIKIDETKAQCTNPFAATSGGYTWRPAERVSVGTKRPGWGDPVAVLLALGGVAAAVAVVASARRRPASA